MILNDKAEKSENKRNFHFLPTFPSWLGTFPNVFRIFLADFVRKEVVTKELPIS